MSPRRVLKFTYAESCSRLIGNFFFFYNQNFLASTVQFFTALRFSVSRSLRTNRRHSIVSDHVAVETHSRRVLTVRVNKRQPSRNRSKTPSRSPDTCNGTEVVMEPASESISVRSMRLHEVVCGPTIMAATSLNKELLFDAIILLFDECNNDPMKSDPLIASFVNKCECCAKNTK